MVDAGGDDVECRAHMMFEGSIARKKIVGELGHVLGTRLCAEKDGIAMLEYITPNSNVYMLLAKSTIYESRVAHAHVSVACPLPGH